MLLARVLGLVVPPACLACGAPPADPSALLCPSCSAGLPWLGRTCPRCALPRCGPCPARDAPWDLAWSPVAHAGPARSLVHALKFDGALRAAALMGAQLAAAAPAWALTAAPPGAGEALAASRAIVPVPAHPWRRRVRGVDHARAIADALGARSGLPVLPALRHRGGTRRQVGGDRAARAAAAAAAIEPRSALPASVVLVDDVHTTGATLRACAAAAAAAGARQTIVLAYARALRS